MGRGATASPGTRRTARSRLGSNATTSASSRPWLGTVTVVNRSPATTCALVTTSLLAATNPLPCWIVSQARPSTFTTAREPRLVSAAGRPWAGGGPTPGAVGGVEEPEATELPERAGGGGGAACARAQAAGGGAVARGEPADGDAEALA